MKKTNVETLMVKNVFDFEYHIYIYIYMYTVSKNELIKWNGLTIVKIFIFYAESDQATIPLIRLPCKINKNIPS